MSQGPPAILPGQPGFEILTVPHNQQNPGGLMSQEALRRLVLARNAGWRYDALVALYDVMKRQIEQHAQGWRADRVKCIDGSTGFIGSKGPVLVIMPNTNRIFVGRFASDGLLWWKPLQQLADGSFAFPSPAIRALGTKEYR